MDCKKGLVYTISIFFLASVLFELVAFTIAHQDRQADSFLATQDGQLLAYRLDELAKASSSSLGTSVRLDRNGTALNFSVQDIGFPLTDNAGGKVRVSEFKNWSERNWSNLTNCSLALNVSYPNTTGIVAQTSGGINYTQNNSAAANDTAFISIPNYGTNGVNITSVYASVYCTAPAGASGHAYSDWVADGTFAASQIYFSDNIGARRLSPLVIFNPDSGTEHYYSVKYLDSTPSQFWMETLHIDWIKPNYTLRIWGAVNGSYVPALTKQNVSCTWNLSVGMNYTNSTQEILFAPMNSSLSCQNASYFGPLVLASK